MASSGSEIQALVYDAYGTLFDVASVMKLCEHHFPGHGAAISDIWRTKQLEYTWLRSLMGRYQNFWALTEDGLGFACAALGLDLSDGARDELMDNYLRLTPYGEVPETLKEMERKIPQAILSNGSPDMLQKVVEYNDLSPYFRAILSVDELEVFKPSPRVYQMAVDKLGVAAENIGFVSSNCWDAIGAKSFGFQVFWINRFKRPLEKLAIVPDQEIQTLDQVMSFID